MSHPKFLKDSDTCVGGVLTDEQGISEKRYVMTSFERINTGEGNQLDSNDESLEVNKNFESEANGVRLNNLLHVDKPKSAKPKAKRSHVLRRQSLHNAHTKTKGSSNMSRLPPESANYLPERDT